MSNHNTGPIKLIDSCFIFKQAGWLLHGCERLLLHHAQICHIFFSDLYRKTKYSARLLLVEFQLVLVLSSTIRGLVASWTSLLHFLLSLVFLNKSSNGIPVHSYMLSIHSILGLPCFLAPGVVPCMISFSRQSPFFLITCPKYDNFLLLTMLSSPRYIPAVSNTHSFFFCVHDTLRIPLC